MSAAEKVGAVVAFLTPFVVVYHVYRAIFAAVDARQRKSLQRARDDRRRKMLSLRSDQWLVLEHAKARLLLEEIGLELGPAVIEQLAEPGK